MTLEQYGDTWRLHSPRFQSDEINPALRVSPWAGHRHFAYDLVAFQRPDLVVELGSHFGCSLFAFSQAAKDLKLDMRLIAVDTWAGDEHAGFYDEQPYEMVQRTRNTYFQEQSIDMKRMLFQEARAQVEDASVDLLHIDGLHTYEAVREDFETWLPKLKPEGLVLFHDVAASTGYGSHRYWKEIRLEHPNMEFEHNWGLGVLFPKGDGLFSRMQAAHVELVRPIYPLKAENELAGIQLRDHIHMVEERDTYIQRLEQTVREYADGICHQDKLVSERDAYIKQLEQRLSK